MRAFSNEVPYKVGLPADFWKQASSKAELKQMIAEYMSVGYPNYIVLKVVKHPELGPESYWAYCERKV